MLVKYVKIVQVVNVCQVIQEFQVVQFKCEKEAEAEISLKRGMIRRCAALIRNITLTLCNH